MENNQRYQQQNFGDTYSLTIYDIHYEDAGRYTLHAENAWGKVTCTAELFVPPTVQQIGRILLFFLYNSIRNSKILILTIVHSIKFLHFIEYMVY